MKTPKEIDIIAVLKDIELGRNIGELFIDFTEGNGPLRGRLHHTVKLTCVWGIKHSRDYATKVFKSAIKRALKNGHTVYITSMREPGNSAPDKCWDSYFDNQCENKTGSYMGFPTMHSMNNGWHTTYIHPNRRMRDENYSDRIIASMKKDLNYYGEKK